MSKKKTKRVVLVRSSAGLFVGELASYKSAEADLRNVRRLWYWTGAASLSQLVTEGTSKPAECKFPCEVDRIIIPSVMEMLDVTPAAKKSIDFVPVWSGR